MIGLFLQPLSLVVRCGNCSFMEAKVIDNPQEMHYIWRKSFNFNSTYYLYQMAEASIIDKTEMGGYSNMNPMRKVTFFVARKPYYVIAKAAAVPVCLVVWKL